MNTFEITIVRAMQNKLLTKANAKYLLNKALRCFSSESYNEIVNEYVTLLKENSCQEKKTI